MDWGQMQSFTRECLVSEWEALVASVWLFAILWNAALQAPPSMGRPRQKYWSGLPSPPPGDLPDPGIEHGPPALQADSSLSEPPWEDRFKASSLVNYPHDFWKIFHPLHPSIHPVVHLLSQKLTLQMNITRWSIPKSDWLYSLLLKMEKLYTVSKNKTRGWLWLTSRTPYCQIQT